MREARFERTAQDAVDVGHRPVGGDRRGDQLAGLGHRVGDDAADGIVGTGGAARSDAEELLRLRGAGGADRGDGQGQGGDPVLQFHAGFSVILLTVEYCSFLPPGLAPGGKKRASPWGLSL
ncbi:hypothetical protein D9M70_586720 [compost metagenome]